MADLTKLEAAVTAAKHKIVDAKKARDDAIAEANATYERESVSILEEVKAAEKALADAEKQAKSLAAVEKLSALGVTKAKAIARVRAMRDIKQPADPDASAAHDAKFRLAEVAERKATEEYDRALADILPEHLEGLFKS